MFFTVEQVTKNSKTPTPSETFIRPFRYSQCFRQLVPKANKLKKNTRAPQKQNVQQMFALLLNKMEIMELRLINVEQRLKRSDRFRSKQPKLLKKLPEKLQALDEPEIPKNFLLCLQLNKLRNRLLNFL